MENTVDQYICQSCGMPLAAKEHFGINKDKSENTEYCCFCYRDGVFTDDFTLPEFVEDLLGNNYESNTADKDYVITKDERVLTEALKLQQLKRWRTHQTHQEYYKSVNKVIEYINQHLPEAINLQHLAQIANISLFHFHRIFKAIINESPGDYIQRLRLEKAAFKLQTTKIPVQDIAEQTGYQSTHALSKAFKKRFAVAPSKYRNAPSVHTIPIKEPIFNMQLSAEIKNIPAKSLISIRVIEPYRNNSAFIHAWQKLLKYVKLDGVPNDKYEYLCISRDISTLTKPDQCRIYACINIGEKFEAKGQFGLQTIDGGTYAVFTHKGSYGDMEKLYCNIYRYWIPNSNYQLRDTLSFEKYLNSPQQVHENELLTEVYIPVNLIKD